MFEKLLFSKSRELPLEIGRQGDCLQSRESPCQKGRVDSSGILKAARERTPHNDEGTLNFIREFTDIAYGQIVVEEEKPFTLIYSRNLETLKLNCFYGFWNSAGFTQHPV